MSDRPMLLRAGRHERRLAIRRSHIEHELDRKPPYGVNDRANLWVVLSGLELDNARLRDPQLLREGPLTQLVLSPISQQRRRELPRRSEPLPLCSKAGIGELLLRHERVKGLSFEPSSPYDNKFVISCPRNPALGHLPTGVAEQGSMAKGRLGKTRRSCRLPRKSFRTSGYMLRVEELSSTAYIG